MSSALRSSTRRLLHPARAWRYATVRGISSTACTCKAQNFTMPALSPTMTEGSISAWRINEGDKFSAGDVILEVETDKAQMDVEAQDDGILAKIFVPASKDQVQVGTRIAVLADIDDDLSSLEIPAEQPVASSSPPPEPQSSAAESTPPPPQSSSAPSEPDSSSSHDNKPRKNPFVASPGIALLLHTHGLEMSDVKGTGPGGRVLKGDVLAHLGKIPTDKPRSLAAEIASLAKLDLSNIKPAAAKPAAASKRPAAPTKLDPLQLVEVSLPISLAKVTAVAPDAPVADAIARAVAFANAGLPPSKIPPSPHDLFDEVLGLPSARKQPRYTVTSAEYRPAAVAAPSPAELFDEVIGAKSARARNAVVAPVGLREFKVQVPAVDRDRAEFFLAKVKFSLEGDVEKV
ncbi:Pyruvate decarboxylase [Drechslerella dactyloides]|uniref:Pyruvate decarboxylase n=1 Tax=Drechslerella dactyloides TaxID=74499 RepID=A0AAD6IYQ9_DREDA|nr:Pyruvate decarboxylase [Drechslerella dactyloides]